MEGELECAIRPLGTDRLAAPVIGRCARRQVHMGEDLGDHHGIDDRGDDLQAATTVWAAFEIDIEHALEQAGPAHAYRGRGGWALGVVIAGLWDAQGRARNDLGP